VPAQTAHRGVWVSTFSAHTFPADSKPSPIDMKNALLTLMVPFTLAACGGTDSQADSAPAADLDAGTVTIITPMNGALINGTDISVTLASTVSILPAGDLTEGSGHHHLYLNAELAPADQPVPSVPGSIIHMGDASTAYVFEDIPAGEYTLIAVVADGVHVPLQPWVVDTVRFTVANQ
jgi:hypothetical protein